MPKFTTEQLEAIEKSGQNIIVSAGAGSGKTEVLSERVLDKLKKGIKVNELLILTFTNAAAAEMKDRIRKKIIENPSIKDNLDYLESAYITTFDSFTLSLVKKYHYLLNVSPNLSIIDESIISILKEQYLDEVFLEFYEEDSILFQKLINDLTNKNDNELKNGILKIIKSLEKISDLDSYLNNYLDNFYNAEKIEEYINSYVQLIQEEINGITDNLMYLESSSYPDFYNALVASLEKLLKSKTYDEILRASFFTPIKRPKGSEEIKEYKDNIDKHLKNIKGYLRFSSEEEIRETFKITKDYLEVIIDIIKRYFVKINIYKKEQDLYEFNDISLMAINLLKEQEYIRKELMLSFKEILVDEYQDTNDIQEEFISLIENNNVYMVGDIKQSIYGFRDANPKIFKEKYDKYAKNNGGIKIDLLKNFRSRSEVLDGINLIFSLIMDDEVGNANYTKEHKMNAGNSLYEKIKENNNLEIYNYDSEGEVLKKEELEAFIIGYDILEKVSSGYAIMDKKLEDFRKASYSDFCIIMDRGTNFPTYKKIFEYLGIPLTIYEDKKLTNEMDIILISNIIGFILKVQENVIDQEFKYYFMSIARSFLFAYSDAEIFKYFKDESFMDSEIYQISKNIVSSIDTLDSYELLNLILKEFNFYEKILKTKDIASILIRLDNILSISKNLSQMGYTITMFKEYLETMINSKSEIKYSISGQNTNSVKIMNIHKSKGLEFPICYFAGYYKKFNDEDTKKRIIFNKKYGMIIPFFKDGIDNTILKDLFKEEYYLNNISEEIRLFYVALTRAREKIIIVAPLSEERVTIKNKVDYQKRLQYTSFLDILNSISGNLSSFIKNIDLAKYNLPTNYNVLELKKENLNKSNDIIKYYQVNIPNTLKEEHKASKEVKELITDETRKLFQKGTLIHKIFEQTDFLNLSGDNPYYKQIQNFVNRLQITKDVGIYKEYEFIYDKDNITYEGIIDLVLEYPSEVKIIDYKLKNITDEKYQEQLHVYRDYLKTIVNKDIKMYLYSIFDDELKEID